MTKDKIALYLAQGVPAANVAAIVGCTPAYISQLCSQDEFKLMIQKHRTETVPAKTDDELLSTKYESMEHRLLSAMEAALPGAELRDITSALKTVADRQNARAKYARISLQPGQIGAGGTINVIQIGMPAHVIPTLTFNNNNEVVAIDNRPMAPMASRSVANLFERIRAKREGSVPVVSDMDNSVEELQHESLFVPINGRYALSIPEDF